MLNVFKKMLTLAGVALLLMGCNAVNMEKYVDDLYDRMSQEERIAQLRSGYMDDLFDENGKGLPKQQKWFNVDDEGNVTEEDVLDEEGNPVYLVCEPNADLFYCASSANYLHSFYEAENTAYSNMVKGWSGLGGNFFVWTYEVNYYNYMYPYNSYDSMLENMRYFKNQEANHFLYQGLWENNFL